MELRQLTTFRTIATTGSYTRAAQVLGYTQSTVSAQMKNLEQTLQAPLFSYAHRQLTLTATGKRLLPLTEHLLNDYSAIEALSKPAELSGTLRIAAPESLTIYRLPTILAAFRQAYPAVQLQLTNATCQLNRRQLLAGEADVAFMLWPQLVSTELTDQLLGPVAMSCVTSLENQLDFAALTTQSHLPWIINEPDCSYRNQFENALWQREQRRLAPMELWSIEAIKQLVASNVGFSYLPTLTVQTELEQGRLRAVTTPITNAIQAHVLTRRQTTSQPLIAAFLKLVTAQWQA